MALKTLPSLMLAAMTACALAACGGEAPAPAPDVAATTAPAPAPATTADDAAPAATTTPRATATPPTARTRTARPRTSAQAAPPSSTTRQATAPEPAPAAAPEPKPKPAPRSKPAAEREPAGSELDELAIMRLVERASPREYSQAGTVTGTYDGTMTLDATITNRGVVVVFVATVEGGTIEGRALARPIITGSPLAELDGTARITGGTGRFARIDGSGLAVGGKAKLDGSYARVRLSGTVTY